ASALLHDVVQDTDTTLEDIQHDYGPTIAAIIDGLTKISGISDSNVSVQAENFRKMLVTISNDIRVILIKIADRLHNMKTMDAMIRQKQQKIASETLYIYAPLAHRLGLYNIKTELEDLSLKYTEPEAYDNIVRLLQESDEAQKEYIKEFIGAVKSYLDKEKFDYTISGRNKSIYSIHKKMVNKGVPFEEVYDRFAIRIVYKCPEKEEKFCAWKIYSIVTDKFHPNPGRLRDWISTPKSTGYEALHTTVMGPENRWVEVQIRSDRMNELAETGYAAHYKYKHAGESSDSYMDEWIAKVRDTLEQAEINAADLVNEFKLNLLVGEIFVFTPKGDLRSLPKGATALDFAFAIHSAVGCKCLGAKVNGTLVPLNYILQSGDQVEIITGKNQKPKTQWLEFVKTTRARNKIKSALNEDVRETSAYGKEILVRKLRHLKQELNEKTINDLVSYFKAETSQDLFFRFGKGLIDNNALKQFISNRGFFSTLFRRGPVSSGAKTTTEEENMHYDRLVFGDNEDKFNYTMAPCCNPQPGDDVFGFVSIGKGITVHKKDCLNATDMMSNYGYRVLSAKWIDSSKEESRITLDVTGVDNIGLINHLTRIISENMGINIESISVKSKAGMFSGEVVVVVKNKTQLKMLVDKIKELESITNVTVK
ncbi:MAG: RelA/SpoT family protein, partial [Flavobacteriales bacterium]|nr:RelA/SpoT family protein [Flavobacteriales bacterium]